MAFPSWFNEVEYLNNKLAQLGRAGATIDGEKGYTSILQVSDAFKAAGMTAFEHYNTFGSTEGIPPSKIFNPEEYCSFKLRQLQSDPATKADWANAKWEDVQLAIHNSGMSLGQHYTMFGTVEGVSMSNAFDTTAYLTAKLDKLKTAEATKVEWATKGVTDVAKAFNAIGMDAYTHYMTFKGGADEVAADVAFPSSDPVGGGTSNTFYLRDSRNIVGTTGNDVIIGEGGGSLSVMHTIDGGAGKDELRLYNPDSMALGNLNIASIKNVEVVTTVGTAAGADINVAKIAGVQEVWVKGAAGASDITTNAAQMVGLEGTIGGLQTVAVIDRDVNKATSLAVKDATITTGGITYTSTDNTIETLTLTATGTNDIATLTAEGLKTLNIAGEGSLKAAIAGANTAALKEINASEAKGDLKLDVTAANTLTADAKITLGAGNDRLLINASATSLKLDGGAGDKDILALNAGAVNAAMATFVNKAANFETLEFRNSTGTASAIVAKDYTNISDFVFTGTNNHTLTGASGSTAVAGTTGLAVSEIESGDTFAIGINVTGGAGGNGNASGAGHGAAGATGVSFVGVTHAQLDMTLKLTSGSDLTGGKGGDGDTGNAGSINGADGGAGLFIGANIKSFTINSTGDSHEITGGAGGTGVTNSGSNYGSGGDSFAVDNATKNVIITGDADLTIKAGTAGADANGGGSGDAASFKNAVDLVATDFTGKLTTGGSNFIDTIVVGKGGSEITGTLGNDTVTFGAGVDTFVVAKVANVVTSTTDNMTLIKEITAGDKLDFSVDASNAKWFKTGVTTVSDSDDLATAVAKADGAQGNITWFNWNNDTYVVLSGATDNTVTEDYVVKLAGVKDLSGASFDTATDILTLA